jgi:hypothetical protein
LQANYRVAHLLAKESNPFSDGEFIRKCLQHIVQDIYPEKEIVSTASLPRARMTQRVDISSDFSGWSAFFFSRAKNSFPI